MSLNLKPVLDAQTDNEKLDVVNYNFDQIVNNGGGPMGYQGATGSQGLTGLSGAQGSQGSIGPTGVQGFQGAASLDLWKVNTSTLNDTLVPKHGSPSNPPSVMFGVDKLDPLYNSIFNEAAVLLNRKSTAYGYNLELTDDSVSASDGNRIIYSLSDVGSLSTFQMGFANTTSGNPTLWKLYADDFNFADGTNNFASIGSGGFNVFVPSLFRNAATFNNTVRINSGNPGANKILTASDSQGTVAWKNVSEIGGVVPVGTIVPMLTEIFNDNTLFYKDAISNTLSTGQKLRIRHGAGQGSYSGWYLCNGKTWIDGVGSSKQVPNLCSFDYEIADNAGDTAAGGQFGAQGITPNLAIIGGTNISITADYGGSASYSITDTIQADTAVINTNASGTPEYDLTKLVYIIYLGEPGLYWQDGGTNSSGGTTVTHYYLLYKIFSDTDNTSNVRYTTSPVSTYQTSETSGTVVTLTITFTPAGGYAFTSATNVQLRTTSLTIAGTVYTPDSTVTMTNRVLNPNGTITMTLTENTYPSSTDPSTTNLIILGSASATSNPVALTVKRSAVGFSGNNSSAWNNETAYINGNGSLYSATALFASTALTSKAPTGWYAQQSLVDNLWTYRYWESGISTFVAMNMSGVTNAPGAWTLSVDNLFNYGGIGGYPSYGAGIGFSACDKINYAIDVSERIWTSISNPSGMVTNDTCFVVADNYTLLNPYYSSVDFTDNGSEYGYISQDACFGMFSYIHSTGVLQRLSASCASINPTYYDVPDGGGDCSTSGGGGGGTSYGNP